MKPLGDDHFVNLTPTTIICGCGETISYGHTHEMTDRCDGTTSLDVRGP
jgi:hypothetical protein